MSYAKFIAERCIQLRSHFDIGCLAHSSACSFPSTLRKVNNLRMEILLGKYTDDPAFLYVSKRSCKY